jgi:hypothetical protein
VTTFREKCLSIGITGVKTDGTDEFRAVRERKLQRDLKYYDQARREGSQPQGTTLEHTTHAMRESDKLGRAFRADRLAETYHPDIAKEIKPWSQSPYFPKDE